MPDPKPQKRTLVCFTRVASPYQPGDVAGFEPAKAEHYVKLGAAFLCDAKGNALEGPATEQHELLERAEGKTSTKAK